MMVLTLVSVLVLDSWCIWYDWACMRLCLWVLVGTELRSNHRQVATNAGHIEYIKHCTAAASFAHGLDDGLDFGKCLSFGFLVHLVWLGLYEVVPECWSGQTCVAITGKLSLMLVVLNISNTVLLPLYLHMYFCNMLMAYHNLVSVISRPDSVKNLLCILRILKILISSEQRQSHDDYL